MENTNVHIGSVGEFRNSTKRSTGILNKIAIYEVASFRGNEIDGSTVFFPCYKNPCTGDININLFLNSDMLNCIDYILNILIFRSSKGETSEEIKEFIMSSDLTSFNFTNKEVIDWIKSDMCKVHDCRIRNMQLQGQERTGKTRNRERKINNE